MNQLTQTILIYTASFLAVLIVVPCHEFAHAYAAVKNGDNTPKIEGRYTLNPFAHFDILGLVMMILVRFGWAKPVPVNPYNFRNYKKGCIEVAIAGVLTNIVLAFLFCPLYLLSWKLVIATNETNVFVWTYFLYLFLYSCFMLNIGLFVFNLIPAYPLDGYRLLEALTERKGKALYFLRRYGLYILLAVFALSWIAQITGIAWLDILGYLIKWVSWPITKFWGLFIK